jgi:uncharacterized protein (DUF1697 family)
MRYVSMLRGINVSGHRKVSMPELAALYEGLGFRGARTYVQSGNVVFEGGKNDPTTTAAEIEAAIREQLGIPDVDVIIRTAAELDKIRQGNPFLDSADPKTLHVTFFRGKPAANVPDDGSWKPDEYRVAGQEAFVHCPNGYGRTKLNNTFFEKRFSSRATTRNWKSVTTLAEMAAQAQ